MWLAMFGAVALLAYYFARSFEEVGGVRHFTKHGRESALGALSRASIQLTMSQPVTNAATFQLVALVSGGVTGLQAVQTAEANGGVVLASDSILDISESAIPVTAVILIAPSVADANIIARPGSAFAILSLV